MIRITNLVKTWGKHRVLDGVSLEVGLGETAAIIGPSGGGKSTLLRCINGLESFNDGHIAIGGDLSLQGGTNPRKPTLLQIRRKVGMVFQQFNLFPHMTALENVMSGMLYALDAKRADAEERARSLLDRVGLTERMLAKPAQLSGGQQQRVAIARALAVNPAAILFDEPTSALDPQMGKEVVAVMRSLASEGQTTMLVVTHDMEFAKQAASTVFVMEKGKIVESGTPQETIH